LFLSVVCALVANGKGVAELQQFLPAQKFLGIPGKLAGDEFRREASEMKTPSGASPDQRRFYIEDKDLFFSEGKTWALSNQWSLKFMPQLDQLIASHPEVQLSYSVAAQAADG
jgi:hypothetical protein